MSQTVRHQLWIVLAAAIVLFTNLGGPWLWDDDEPRNATCTREMRARGDWIVPTFNQVLRTDKPVLLYWLMRTSYAVFGENEFGARFWSAVLAVGTAITTYHLGRLLFRPEVGFWAGLIVATTIMFDLAGRAATPDSTLIFCATLSLLAFVWGAKGSFATSDSTDENRGDLSLNAMASTGSLVPSRWLPFALMYAAMGLAVLAKGPIGVLGPCGTIGLYLICLGRSPRREASAWSARWPKTDAWLVRPLHKFAVNFLPAAGQMRLLWAVLIVGLVALPWYIAVGVQTDGAWLQGFFGKHNFGRFVSAMEGHRGPIVYYIPAILAGFFPWSIFLPLALLRLVQHLRGGHAWQRGYTFVACWAGLYVGVFSLSGTKLPSYVLPAYPALALITAVLIHNWIRDPRCVAIGWSRVGFASLALVGVGLMVGLLRASKELLPGEGSLAILGLAPLVGAAFCAWYAEQRQTYRAAMSFAVMSVVFCTYLVAIGAGRVSRHQNNARLLEVARRHSAAAPQIGTFDYSAPSVVFYAQSHVGYFYSKDDVARFLHGGDDRFLIASGKRLAELKDSLPPGVGVLERQPRFLRSQRIASDELVLLGRDAQTARAQPAAAWK